jgi:integrase
VPTLTLTDRFVASKARPPKRLTYFDTLTRGLALRVTPKGGKTWYFVYRFNGGPSEWLRLGEYDALGLAAARTEAGTYRYQVDIEKRNPAAEKRTPPPEPEPEAPVMTFATFAPVYMTLAKAKKRSWKDDQQKIDRWLLPAWGPLPLKDITRTHVHELLDGLVSKGLTIGVNRVQALVSRMFTIALDRSLIDAHPAARMIKRFSEHESTRKLTDDELRALWAGLDQFPGAAADAIRLRLLLGQRGGETAGMLWSEVDLDEALWSLPPERTKNRRAHAVPLPPRALALLTARRKAIPDAEPAVFPGLTLQGDEHKALGVLHGGAFEWKDLRRTVATRLGDLGYDDALIGRVLNHAQHTVTAKHYNQAAYLDEKRRALDAWDRELAGILDPAAAKARKVLKHRPRKAAR